MSFSPEMPYVCEHAKLRQSVPLAHGHYDFCYRGCPHYPETKRVRVTPFSDIQRDDGNGTFKQSPERHRKPRIFKRACAICGVTYTVDSRTLKRETCGSQECIHKLVVMRRVAKIEQKKRDTIDISGCSEDELENCPVCGRLYRPLIKGQKTCLQGMCPQWRNVRRYHLTKGEEHHDVEAS